MSDHLIDHLAEIDARLAGRRELAHHVAESAFYARLGRRAADEGLSPPPP